MYINCVKWLTLLEIFGQWMMMPCKGNGALRQASVEISKCDKDWRVPSSFSQNSAVSTIMLTYV